MSDRRDIIMRRIGGLLKPVSPAEDDALCEYPEDKDLWVTIRRKRSVIHNAKYWAMLTKVIASGATRYHSVTSLHKAIKFELGYVKALTRLTGETIYETDSTAFDRMDQTEFNLFFENAMRLIAENYAINPEEL